MAGECLIVWNVDPTKRHMIAGTEGMHIQSRAGTHIAESVRLDSFRAGEIFRCSEFDVAGFTGEYAHFYAGPFGERGVVGKIAAALCSSASMRFKQRREGESLRCLHQADEVAVKGCLNDARLVDPFDGVVYRQGGNSRTGFLCSFDRACNQTRAGKWPRRVMNEYDVWRVWQERL